MPSSQGAGPGGKDALRIWASEAGACYGAPLAANSSVKVQPFVLETQQHIASTSLPQAEDTGVAFLSSAVTNRKSKSKHLCCRS